jgi:hypothetical protein
LADVTIGQVALLLESVKVCDLVHACTCRSGRENRTHPGVKNPGSKTGAKVNTLDSRDISQVLIWTWVLASLRAGFAER